jgi:hypothetical protein
MGWYHDKLGHRWYEEDLESGLGPVHYYPRRRISAMVNATSTIMASLLPTVSMFALYFIRDPLARMGAILAFTTLFSIVLTLFTKARRAEVFAAAAAFAAVQVVFVGQVPAP